MAHDLAIDGPARPPDDASMDEVMLGILFVLAVIGGWVLGVIGFFSARRALADVATLRRQLDASRGAPENSHTAPAPDPGSIWVTPGQPTRAEPASPSTTLPGSRPAEPPPFGVAASTPSPFSYSPSQPPRIDHAPSPETSSPDALSPDAPPSGAPSPHAPPPLAPPPTDLETLLTTRWGVWLGAAALLMAGVFLIRYAVEQDMLGPEVRCVLAALLGVALIGAAEWLRGKAFGGPADQAPPALASGGVGVLFGAAYGAGVLYELVPPAAGFVLLAGASMAGLALSLRHGQLVAAVGIAGAFVTPALVGSNDSSLPGLFFYLLFVTASALAVVRYTAWVWLGRATTIGGAVWVLVATAAASGSDAWAPALFVVVASALNLILLPSEALDHPIGRRLGWIPLAVLGASGLLLAMIECDWATRAGVLLLAPLTVWKAAREPRLRLLPFVSATMFLLLLLTWDVQVTDWPDLTQLDRYWTPEVVLALLGTASLTAGFYAASGWWFQQRTPYPLPWASLTASVPVLALAVCYGRVTLFQPRVGWALSAYGLAAGLIGLTAMAMRQAIPNARQIAGVHAAGAVAALALGTAMVLADQWLTLTVSLILPALAWVEAKADLPPLRLVARTVAVVVLIRLLANWYVLDYAFGGTPILNGLLPAYGVPAVAFAVAAWMFRQRGDDMTVGVLEAGAIAFATVPVALEIRHLAGAGALDRISMRFGEAALHVASLSIMALVGLRIAIRLRRPVLIWGSRIQGALALAGGVFLLLANPAITGEVVGTWPILDWLLPAYLLPAVLAVVAARSLSPPYRTVLASYALLAMFMWITLEIRHLFHGATIGPRLVVTAPELWSLSGGWLAYGAALLVAGLRMRIRPLRLAGIGLVGLVAVKVFIVDMAELDGLWRVLSFLGLGLSLIALGTVYRRLAVRPASHTGPHTGPHAGS